MQCNVVRYDLAKYPTWCRISKLIFQPGIVLDIRFFSYFCWEITIVKYLVWDSIWRYCGCVMLLIRSGRISGWIPDIWTNISAGNCFRYPIFSDLCWEITIVKYLVWELFWNYCMWMCDVVNTIWQNIRLDTGYLN